MAVNPNRQKLVHLNSATVKAPEGVLNKGEIAVQYANEDPALYIEKADGSLAKFISSAAVQTLIDTSISAATEEFVALKADVTEAVGDIEAELSTLSGSVVSNESAIAEISGNSHSHENKSVLDGISSEDVEAWDAAAESAHTHANAAVLDDITAEKVAAWDEAAESAHTHANAAVLDDITAEKVAAWDEAAESAHTHANADVLDAITSEKVAAWDEAAESAHTHANADVLDAITSEKVAAWDEAAESAHTHANADVLDAITSEKVAAWDEAAESAHTHANAEVLDAITAEKVAAWDEAAESAHTHANQDELDLIQSGDVAKWNALSGAAQVVVSARTSELSEGILKSYDVYQGGEVVGSIDIPKDLVVTSGGIVTVEEVKYLRLFIANQSEPVDVAVTDLVDAYTEGDGIEISTGNVISAKVVEANGLSVDGSGIAMAAASAEGAGAMSSADFTKLAGIESGANVNTIEGVQVNGADLTLDADKKVNVTVTSGSANGTIAVNGSDVEVTGLGSAAFEDATAFDAAGAAEAASAAAVSTVVGTAEDTSADTTVYGAKAYADELVAGVINDASGDTYVSATVDGQTVKVEATQSTKDSLALADSSLQGIETGKESGAQVNANNKLDFSSFGIDCGTY